MYGKDADYSFDTQTPDTSQPWWQGPPPPGYSGPWPPPLPPGGSYGGAPGQINYATPPAGAQPPEGSGQTYWDPTLNAGQGGWSTAGLTNAPGAPGSSFYTGPTVPTGGGSTGGGGGGSTGSGGGNGTLGSLLSPISMPFSAPAQVPYPTAPMLHLPNYTPPPAFKLPTWEEVMANDPGFQFRMTEGMKPFTNSAAASGLYRSGGTLKDFIKYGQDYASGEYGAGVQRAEDVYNTNYKTQYTDPYTFDVQKATSEFQPQEFAYQTQYAGAQHQNDVNYANALSLWDRNFDLAKFNKTWPYTVLSDQQHLGASAAGAI
jgi:hypothetical protein